MGKMLFKTVAPEEILDATNNKIFPIIIKGIKYLKNIGTFLFNIKAF